MLVFGFVVLVWFLVLLDELNLSYSDVDSQLGIQSQEPQDVGILVNSGISIICYKSQSVIQHIILVSYYVPGTVLGGEED